MGHRIKQKKVRSKDTPVRSDFEQKGIEAFHRGAFGDAVVAFSRALQQDRKNPRLLFDLGSSFQRVAEHELAVKAFRAALEHRADDAAIYNNLGLSLVELGHHEAAANAFRRAIDIDPNLFEAFGNLGNALRTAGFLREAADAYRQAMALRPENPAIHRAHVLTRVYDPEASNQTLFDLAREFEARHTPNVVHPAHENGRDPNRKLRIGYLSSDFRDHPAGHNLAPLFFNHDKTRFETFVYAELTTRDFMTDAFRAAADHYVATSNRSDEEVAAAIRKDRVDILVFLAGYLDANRSLIAARKPAPVQVSYHDVATSGLVAMDYWMTDAFCSPKGGAERFTERLVRLPRLLVYRPIDDAPEVGPLPCAENGFVTFGSLNNPAKLNDQVIALYADVLSAVPGSRLLLKYTGAFDSAETRGRFLARFNMLGVASERILFRSKREDRKTHLMHYHDVDIALDTFPFNGVTTTFEALYMGVPVVTLPGERFIARAAGSILRSIGFEAGIARDRSDYVGRAQAFSTNRAALGQLRRTLRARMSASPLMDEVRYARTLERAFRAMWRLWCRTGA